MSRKHMMAFAGVILVLAFSFPLPAESFQAGQNSALENQRPRTFFRGQNRIQFIDEDGDGICDYYRDHDNDGIPNRQDPDWISPQDGTGYHVRNRNGVGVGRLGRGNGFGQGNSFGQGNRFNRDSFRFQQNRVGNCGAVRPYSRGNGNRRGRR